MIHIYSALDRSTAADPLIQKFFDPMCQNKMCMGVCVGGDVCVGVWVSVCVGVGVCVCVGGYGCVCSLAPHLVSLFNRQKSPPNYHQMFGRKFHFFCKQSLFKHILCDF